MALEAEARVLMFGDSKYGRDNWRKGLHYTRLLDAALRHIIAFADGEDLDPETGESHLAHAKCCMSMVMAMPKEWDDRVQKPEPQKEEHPHEWSEPPSCLDAAYERRAIDQGFNIENPFPENVR